MTHKIVISLRSPDMKLQESDKDRPKMYQKIWYTQDLNPAKPTVWLHACNMHARCYSELWGKVVTHYLISKKTELTFKIMGENVMF